MVLRSKPSGDIAGVFVPLGKAGLQELAIVGDIGARDVALPSVEEDPGSGIGIPDGARSKDAPRERKGGGIELEKREIGELVAFRIEELVVEDAAGLAAARLSKDPILVGMQNGLRGAALDDVVQRLLPPVGLRQIELIEEKEA